ncbi:MAG: polyprenyl synthetase family protein [Proteobacteria bacterium]|nr:polyprenyl synthetase family protein [Pseudomonadota bacterium]MBU0966061.1 polyprenyl synthetase family protein [Pseudomonadota bacterium]
MNKNELLALLQPDIEQINETMRNEISQCGNAQLQQILEYALFNGGKRIRPILTVLSARLCAFSRMPEGLAEEDELKPPVNLYRLASVFEFLHGASLLHDDVIDNAGKRRGKPSANRVWDNTQVILAGDFLHARALTMAGTVGDSHTLSLIGTATAAMIQAEFLQMQAVQERNLSEKNYFSVLRGKTGCLISVACEVGAYFAQSGDEHQKALRGYGDALGLAFQIVDDLLDYQGDPHKTGKAVGNDFVEGKMTLPLIHALQNCDRQEFDHIMDLLKGNASVRAEQISEVRGFIEQYDGFTYAGQGAETLIEAAHEALAVFPDCQSRKILAGLANYVLTRQK